jgi:hypothetical protein
MDSTASLVSGLLFASIGTGYLIYGKKQQNQLAFYTGLTLLVYPYLVDQLLWLLGLALMAVPVLFKR